MWMSPGFPDTAARGIQVGFKSGSDQLLLASQYHQEENPTPLSDCSLCLSNFYICPNEACETDGKRHKSDCILFNRSNSWAKLQHWQREENIWKRTCDQLMVILVVIYDNCLVASFLSNSHLGFKIALATLYKNKRRGSICSLACRFDQWWTCIWRIRYVQSSNNSRRRNPWSCQPNHNKLGGVLWWKPIVVLSVAITNCCSTQQAHSVMTDWIATSMSDGNLHNLSLMHENIPWCVKQKDN